MANPWEKAAHAERFRDGAVPNNPSRPAQVDVVVALARAHAPGSVLDLGCGPGFLAERLAAALPEARLVACDLQPRMVELARERLGPRAVVVQRRVEDRWHDLGGPFDLVLAVQVLHHLDAAGKRLAYRKILDVLAPGGLLVQSDPVAPRLFRHHVALWNRLRGEAGFDPLPPDYDEAAFRAELEERGDLLDTLRDQATWMREAGFDPVEVFWRDGNRAVWGGLRP